MIMSMMRGFFWDHVLTKSSCPQKKIHKNNFFPSLPSLETAAPLAIPSPGVEGPARQSARGHRLVGRPLTPTPADLERNLYNVLGIWFPFFFLIFTRWAVCLRFSEPARPSPPSSCACAPRWRLWPVAPTGPAGGLCYFPGRCTHWDPSSPSRCFAPTASTRDIFLLRHKKLDISFQGGDFTAAETLLVWV